MRDEGSDDARRATLSAGHEDRLDRPRGLGDCGLPPRALAVPRRSESRSHPGERSDLLIVGRNGQRVRLKLVLAVALAMLTLAVYAPVRGFDFLDYDDNVYVVG